MTCQKEPLRIVSEGSQRLLKKMKIKLCMLFTGAYRVQSWKGLSAAVLQGCVLGHWINISISVLLYLEELGSFAISVIWADSAYNSRHPFMAVAFCGAACIFVSSSYPLCSDYLFCYLFALTFCSVLVFFHTSGIVYRVRSSSVQWWLKCSIFTFSQQIQLLVTLQNLR